MSESQPTAELLDDPSIPLLTERIFLPPIELDTTLPAELAAPAVEDNETGEDVAEVAALDEAALHEALPETDLDQATDDFAIDELPTIIEVAYDAEAVATTTATEPPGTDEQPIAGSDAAKVAEPGRLPGSSIAAETSPAPEPDTTLEPAREPVPAAEPAAALDDEPTAEAGSAAQFEPTADAGPLSEHVLVATPVAVAATSAVVAYAAAVIEPAAGMAEIPSTEDAVAANDQTTTAIDETALARAQAEALQAAVLQRIADRLPDQVDLTVRELLQPSIDRAISQISEEAQVALRIALQDLVEQAVREELGRSGKAPD